MPMLTFSRSEILHSGKFPEKKSLFEAETWYLFNFNTLNSMVVLNFCCFRSEIFYLSKFGTKYKNCFSKVKLST